MGKDEHVVPHNGSWGVRGAGNKKVTEILATQEQAIDRARSITRNQGSELFIHGRNGQIRDRDSYGSDPNPPRDKKH